MIKVSLSVLVAIAIIAVSLVCSSGSILADSGVTESTTPTLVAQPATPPVGFSPLTASNAELAKYGLPPRPTDPVALKSWNTVMACAKTYVPTTTTVATGDIGLVGLATTTQKTHAFWCGYQDDPYYNKVGSKVPYTYPGTGNPNQGICYMSFRVPSTMVNGNGIAAFWTGFSDGVQIDQAAVCVGTNIPAQGGSSTVCPMMQNYPGKPIWVNDFPISLGDSVYISVNAVSQYSTSCTFIDMTKGTYTTKSLTISKLRCPSVYSKVDFIYEAYQGVGAYPTAWGSTNFWDCGFKSVVNSVVTFPYVDQWNNNRFTMKPSSGHIYGTASALSGHGFSVTSYP